MTLVPHWGLAILENVRPPQEDQHFEKSMKVIFSVKLFSRKSKEFIAQHVPPQMIDANHDL